MLRTAALILLGSTAFINPAKATNGYCFPTNSAEFEQALTTPTCNDITLPAGTLSLPPIQIKRSNIKIHGAEGTKPAEVTSSVASTILTPSACIAGPFINVGDYTSQEYTYTGIDIADLGIVIPGGCDMRGIHISSSATGSGNYVRRVRITQAGGAGGSGNSVGVAIEPNVWSWRFENVIIDRVHIAYNFHNTNNFIQVIGGECSYNTVCAQYSDQHGGQSIQFVGVDVEGNLSYGFDIWGSQGFIIRDCYIDPGNGRAIRLGANNGIAYGTVIDGNLFTNGNSAGWAIELDGFYGLSITNNNFSNFLSGNVLNLGSGSGGIYTGNTSWFPGGQTEVSNPQGFDVIHWTTGPNKGFKIY